MNKQQIKTMVADGKLLEALQAAQTHYPKLADDLRLLQARYNSAVREKTAGTLTSSKFDSKIATIQVAFFEYLKEIAEPDTPQPKPHSQPINPGAEVTQKMIEKLRQLGSTTSFWEASHNLKPDCDALIEKMAEWMRLKATTRHYDQNGALAIALNDEYNALFERHLVIREQRQLDVAKALQTRLDDLRANFKRETLEEIAGDYDATFNTDWARRVKNASNDFQLRTIAGKLTAEIEKLN